MSRTITIIHNEKEYNKALKEVNKGKKKYDTLEKYLNDVIRSKGSKDVVYVTWDGRVVFKDYDDEGPISVRLGHDYNDFYPDSLIEEAMGTKRADIIVIFYNGNQYTDKNILKYF